MKFIYVICLIFSFTALAHMDHQGSCSQKTRVCAVYQSDSPFSTLSEGRFILFLNSPEGHPVVLKKIDLWMQMGNHGHGSSPLNINKLSPSEYDVTKVYFVMKGVWQIRVTYAFETHDHDHDHDHDHKVDEETLIIPVTIRD